MTIRTLTGATCACLTVIGGNSALCDEIHVYEGESIQAAIDGASNDDEIVVHPGTYHELINFTGKAITLRSSDGWEFTTIDGGQAGTVVTCSNHEDSNTVLDGFTITAGNAQNGGGMYNYDSSPTVANCLFTGNSSSLYGGGIYNYNGGAAVINCTFSANSAGFGGGIYSRYGEPAVAGSVFHDNEALAYGGGICNYSANATVNNCTFMSNTAGYGAGICNTSDSGDCYATVLDCTIESNHAIADGGGVYNYRSDSTITNCRFTENSADGGGGGICNATNGKAILSGCTFVANQAGQEGGGVFSPIAPIDLFSCILRDNSATDGGGMYITYSGTDLINCLFLNNHADGRGGGLYSTAASSVDSANCTFGWNEAGTGGGAIGTYNAGVDLDNCILWGDLPSEIDYDGSWVPTVRYSCVQNGSGEPWFGSHCIDADPLFADADLRIGRGSPCIDAAANPYVPDGAIVDLDGNGRFMDDPDMEDTGAGDPPIVDMGAYEFQGESCAADVNDDDVVDIDDLFNVLAMWGPCDECKEDINHDGVVDIDDIFDVLSFWGPCP